MLWQIDTWEPLNDEKFWQPCAADETDINGLEIPAHIIAQWFHAKQQFDLASVQLKEAYDSASRRKTRLKEKP